MFRSWIARQRLHKLIDGWVRYRRIVLEALDPAPSPGDGAGAGGGSTAVVPRPDPQGVFLNLQARMAMQLQHLSAALPSSSRSEASPQIARISDLLKRHTTPGEKSPGEPWKRADFEQVWHEHFVFLSELKGMSLAAPSAASRRAASVPRVPGQGARALGGFLRFASRLVLVGAVIVVGGYFVASGLGISRENGRFVVDNPTSFGGAVESGLNGVSSLVTWLIGAVSPVLAAYGTGGAIALAAALILALAYWGFLRG